MVNNEAKIEALLGRIRQALESMDKDLPDDVRVVLYGKGNSSQQTSVTDPTEEGSRLLADSNDVNRTNLVELYEATNLILKQVEKDSIPGAINWSDLRCVDAQKVKDMSGDEWLRVEIEEADPESQELHEYVSAELKKRGFHDVEVVTEC